MSKKIFKAYGLEIPLIDVPHIAKTSTRAPTATDRDFALGDQWIQLITADTRDLSFFGGLDSSGDAIWMDAAAPDGTTTTKGIVRLATIAETQAGILDTIANTPAGLAAVAIAGAPDASETVKGIAEIATTAETVAFTDDTRIVSPAKVGDAFAAPPAIGSGTPAAGSFTTIAASGLASLNASATIVTGATALNLGADAGTGAVNLGTGAAARTLTLGNITTTTAVAINSGTGHITLTSTGAGDVLLVGGDKIQLDAAGTVDINSSAAVINIGDDDVDQAINIATDGERTTTIGSSNGAASLVLDCGTGALNIGTNGIAHTLTLGNQIGATALVLETGTGNFSLDGVGATAYTIGASTTGGTTTIGGTAQTGTITLGDSSGINIVQIGSGEGATTVAIAGGATAAKVVTIADGAVANLVTIGSASGAASLDLLAGTGNFTLEGATATTYDFSATGANTGTFTLAAGTGARIVNLATGAGGVKTVNLATGAIGNIVTIGTVSAAASLDLLCGTGNFTLEGNVASTYDISSTGINTGTVTIGSGTGARIVELAGGGTGIKTINIGTGATADVITIGTTDGAGSLDLVCGTGSMTLSSTGAGDISINSDDTLLLDSDGVLELNSSAGIISIGNDADAFDMNFGTGAAQRDIIVGNATGTTSVVVNVGTGAASFAINATDHTTTIGGTTGTSALNLQSGGTVTVTGDLLLGDVATQFGMNGGAVTDFIGRATLVAGTVTVANTNIAAGDRIFLTRSALNGSPALGHLVTTINAGASFVINAYTNAGAAANTDVTTLDYFIVRQS